MERHDTMSLEEVTAPALPGSALETMLDDKTTSTWFRRDRIVFPWQKTARTPDPGYTEGWNDSDVALYPAPQNARGARREPTVRRWPVRFSAAVENLNARGRSFLRGRSTPPPPPSHPGPRTLRGVAAPPAVASTRPGPRTLRGAAAPPAVASTRPGVRSHAGMTARSTAVAAAQTVSYDAAQSGVVPAVTTLRGSTIPPAHRAFAPASTLTGGAPAVATRTARGINPAAWEERAAEAQARAVSEEAAQFRGSSRLPFWVVSILLGGALFVAMLFAGVVMFVDPSGNVLLEAKPADAELSIDGERVPGETSPFYVNRLRAGDHELWVHKPGFQERRESFHVEPGATLRLPAIELLREGEVPSAPPAAAPPPAAETPAPVPAKARPSRSDSVSQRLAAALPSTPGASAAVEPSSAASPATSASNPGPGNTMASNRDSDLLEPAAPAPAAAPEEPEPAGAAGVAGDNIGLLRVNSLPWSQVFIDGRPVGNTPLLGVPLKAGEHRVELVNQTMGLTKTIRVSIRKDQIVTKIVNLGE